MNNDLIKTSKVLRDGGIENYFQEAQFISKKFTDDGLKSAVARRLSGEPLQYILGEWDFFGRVFKVGKGVLIPRPETEILVELCIDFVKNSNIKEPIIYDLCAGSGCISITIAKELPNAKVFAVEKELPALTYLMKNIQFHKSTVKPIFSDVFDFIPEFTPHIILTNPPYLSEIEMSELQKEVTFEPETALYGGDNGGVYFIERLIKHYQAKNLFAIEVGDNQSEYIKKVLLSKFPEFKTSSKKDLNGIERLVYTIKEK